MTFVPWRATASAEPPTTAITTSGQALAVDIASPTSPATVAAPGALTIAGTATIGAPQTTPLNAAFVVDLSGSTGGSTAYDCNANGLTDAGDDFNNSGGGFGQLLDCEVAGVLAVNNGLIARGNTETAIVGFAQNAAVADMQSTAGDQVFTPAANDSLPPLPGDVETVARSVRTNNGSASIDQYSKRSGLGSSGQYQPALKNLVTAFGSQPAAEERVAFFMADGLPSDGNAYTSEMAAVTGANIKINTFAVGLASGGCVGTALGAIASGTGGTCVNVASPAALTAVIAQGATIAAVEYSVNGLPFAPVTTFDAVTGDFQLALPVTRGAHNIRVRARAADGTLAQDSLDVVGADAPDVGSAELSVAEGSPLLVPGVVDDLDTSDAGLTFAWTPVDGRLAPTDAEDTTFQADDDEGSPFVYTLTATDSTLLSGSGLKTINVSNVAPTIDSVNAPPIVNEGQEAAFSVGFSDPGTADSHSVRFDWGDDTEDTVVELDERTTAHTVNTTHIYAAGSPDPFLVVTVTDDDGGVQTSRLLIDINHGPTAALDEDAYAVVEGGSVPISATFADVDGDGLSADITVDGTPVVSGSVASGESLGYVVGAPQTDDDATLPIAANVTDVRGLDGSSDSATLTVLNAPPLLSGVAAPDSTLPKAPISITGSFSDAGVLDTHDLTVDWGDGTTTPRTAVSGGSFVADHSYATFGTYDGELQLCDDDLGCATHPFTIAVGTPPTADGGTDLTLNEGEQVTLSGTASDADAADGQSLTYHWTPDNDGLLVGADTLTPTFYAVNQGVYEYTLRVCDSQGVCDVDSVSISVANLPPTIDSLAAFEDRAAQLAYLDVAWSDPGSADTFTLRIDWGDGAPAQLINVDPDTVLAPLSHAYGAPGDYLIGLTVTDDGGASASSSTQLTVVLNQAPFADANAGGPYSVPEGGSLVLTGTASDPNGDGFSVIWNEASLFSAGRETLQPTFVAGEGGSTAGTTYQVSMVATDTFGAATTSNAVVTVTNVAPTITAVSGPTGPVPIGTAPNIEVAFADPSPTDTHTVDFVWDDGATNTVNVTSDRDTATASHSYGEPGVNTVTITVTDDDGASTSTVFEYVVAYDPTAGFVTGAGSIESPPGAYPADPLATGTARFGIASRYAKGSNTPSGDTAFQFKAVGLEFKSTSNDYLVISGAKATYRGSGNVNGTDGYGFIVTVIDGAKTGNDDRLRIRIWDKNRGNAVVYDNEITKTDPAADPTTTIATGSIVIHKA